MYIFDHSMLSLKPMKNHLIIEDWGFIHYEEAWKRQGLYQNYLIQRKRDPEKQNSILVPETGHFLICCEHPHVYTIGKTGSNDHLLVNDDYLKEHNISQYNINRGGDITYHGPGQIVLYPILDLEMFFKDLHKYIRFLEEVIIRTLADLGIKAYRKPGFTGVWTGPSQNRKICAIGIHMNRWVSMHGLAFNVSSDLKYFDFIVACGIKDKNKTVTSLEKEMGTKPDIQLIKNIVYDHFIELFQFRSYEKKNMRTIPDHHDSVDLTQ